MPISSKTFASTPDSVNPQILDLFIKNPSKAYSFTELNKKFSNANLSLTSDLMTLLLLAKIETRFINGDSYYCLKKKV